MQAVFGQLLVMGVVKGGRDRGPGRPCLYSLWMGQLKVACIVHLFHYSATISSVAPEIGTVLPYRPTMFHTATVRLKRSGPSILYNTPLREQFVYTWEP